MKNDRAENLWLVVITCLMAIIGVIALRTTLRLDYQIWSAAYLATGLTAALRRTSRGIDCTTLSVLRGLACLAVGIYATQEMGYPGISFRSASMLPEEILAAIHWPR